MPSIDELRACRAIFREARKPWSSNRVVAFCEKFLELLDRMTPVEWAENVQEFDLDELKQAACEAIEAGGEIRWLCGKVYSGIGSWLFVLEERAGVPPRG